MACKGDIHEVPREAGLVQPMMDSILGNPSLDFLKMDDGPAFTGTVTHVRAQYLVAGAQIKCSRAAKMGNFRSAREPG